MKEFATVIGAAVVFMAIILVAAPLGAAFGALAGWTAGLVFGDTILGVLGKLGLRDVAMWQLGATLGFVGSFLRTTTTVKGK